MGDKPKYCGRNWCACKTYPQKERECCVYYNGLLDTLHAKNPLMTPLMEQAEKAADRVAQMTQRKQEYLQSIVDHGSYSAPGVPGDPYSVVPPYVIEARKRVEEARHQQALNEAQKLVTPPVFDSYNHESPHAVDQVDAGVDQEYSITTNKQARKEMPIVRGMLDYFPLACLAVANCSHVGNEQHNPGEPMHWAREKSTDQVDCAVRHLMERGKRDTDGVRHSAKAAWRALANLQLEIEADGGDI